MNYVKEAGSGSYEEKKSRFLGAVFPISCREDAQERIMEQRKRHYEARHHCYAYILGEKGEEQRQSDDGEPSRNRRAGSGLHGGREGRFERGRHRGGSRGLPGPDGAPLFPSRKAPLSRGVDGDPGGERGIRRGDKAELARSKGEASALFRQAPGSLRRFSLPCN